MTSTFNKSDKIGRAMVNLGKEIERARLGDIANNRTINRLFLAVLRCVKAGVTKEQIEAVIRRCRP